MASYEYCDLAAVTAELRTTTNFSSTSLPTANDVTTWIEQASAEVNQIAGRTYGATPYSETFDYSGKTRNLLLQNAPVISVTSVLYSTSALGTATYGLTATKTEDTDYTVYDNSGEIELLSSWIPSAGKKRIQVNYTAGYITIPDTIVMLTTKKVTKRVLDTVISKDISEKQSGKSVSIGSISVVKPAEFGVRQYATLNDNIATLEQDIIGGTTLYRLPMNRLS